jgi:predicted RNA polymerase sigma factor
MTGAGDAGPAIRHAPPRPRRAPQLRQARRLSGRAHARRGGAEDALSEAFAAALADWPLHGVPQTPDAWLLTVARRKMTDAARRRRLDETRERAAAAA